MPSKNVRFIASFFIEIVKTEIDQNGQIQVAIQNIPVEFGHIYKIEDYEDDGVFLKITFPKGSRLEGIAQQVTKAYAQISDIVSEQQKYAALPSSGCGCGKK